MNHLEKNSIRARVMYLKQGKDWGGGTQSVRAVDATHVNTTSGTFEVEVDGENTWLKNKKGERRFRMKTKDYARLMNKNIDKLIAPDS